MAYCTVCFELNAETFEFEDKKTLSLCMNHRIELKKILEKREAKK